LERATVCVIGGGVVGASVTLALARRGVEVVLVEAEPELALGASGTNSGILHTGYDARPGTLEAQLVRRSLELREETFTALGVPLLDVGGVLRPQNEQELAAIDELEVRAQRHGSVVERERDGSLFVPGEAVTDPVAFTLALAGAAERAGARIICGTRVKSIEGEGGDLVCSTADTAVVRCQAAVNCAGLHADDVARGAGDVSFRILPRKGEFLVFDPPGGRPLEQILLSVPSARTKGVLVFPTTDGKVVAGPTVHDQKDKRDWSVRPEARREVLEKATVLMPELEGCEPVASYAGLRTAGDGVNYLIERSRACSSLLHVAAIRSTGMSASLGIAEYAVGKLEELGVRLESEQPLEPGEPAPSVQPWWRRSANYWVSPDAPGRS
jgi:glycerol-3-phosphate dehydrogenase